MNKLLIVLLAVCLVSAHAFVKRDAPEAPASDLQKQIAEVQAKMEEIAKNITSEAAKVFDPEAVQKSLDVAIETAKQALDKLKPGEAKPAA